LAKRESTLTAAEHKLEDFVEDMGQVLSAVRTRAEGWLSERQRITKTLSDIRDTATGLLRELGHQAEVAVQRVRGRRGRRRRGARAATAAASGRSTSRKRRVFSAETRARMAEAQRKRWAAARAKQK
jgi:hypothetical protein